MHIQKFKKAQTNKYKVYIDDEEYVLYDDIIIKYNLLLKKEITEEELNEIINTNTEYSSYYDCIRYINRRIRSEHELIEYLKKKDIDINIINNTISRLKSNNFINDELFAKAFINDKINLSYQGPKKIKDELIKHNIDINVINTYLDEHEDEWLDRINNYISKKEKVNHFSSYVFKRHMQVDLHTLGYSSDMINECINNISIDDNDALIKDYNKIKNKLNNKYSGDELKYKIKQKLYSKGYKINDIEGVINEN